MLRSKKILILPLVILTVVILAVSCRAICSKEDNSLFTSSENEDQELVSHPLSIEFLRQGEYPGSEIIIEQTLTPGSNYQRYIASYQSEGLKIFGLLTVPNGTPSENGWPAVILNHGYISPSVYQTTQKYVAYQDAFARSGYLTFKPDFRGHGDSEGEARGGYGSNDYTIDVLNALASIKKYPGVAPQKIGMWGHSMGGHITLEVMVVSREVKAGVIWSGVVASYEDLFNRWHRRNATPPPEVQNSPRRRWRDMLMEEYGSPEANPSFWHSISATSYLDDVSGPIQLHHGTADSSVPIEFSEKLEAQLKEIGKEVEFYQYPGDDHNLSQNLSLALQRSVEFFDKYLKD